MAKALACPVCGVKITGRTTDDVMQNGMEHAKKAGHPEMSPEAMDQLKAQIKEE